MNRISRMMPLFLAILLSNIAVADEQEKDADTMRFESELRSRSQMMRYPLQEEVIASQVSIFQQSSPVYREAIWDAFEKDKVQQTQQKEQEIKDTLERMRRKGLE